MNDLSYCVGIIIKHNKDGSFATRYKRKQVLKRACDILWNKFPGLKLKNLNARHLFYLIETWKGHASIKSELSHVRWLLEKINKSFLWPPGNDALGILRRTVVTTENKSWILKVDVEKKIGEVSEKDKTAGLFLQLCVYLGLRFEEASLFRPHEDIMEGYVQIVRGTKGGRTRTVNIIAPEQKILLDLLKQSIEPGKCLVPQNRRLIEFKNQMYYILRKCGISKKGGLTVHGLRHTYACRRFETLTGEPAPVIKKAMGYSGGDIKKLHGETDKIARQIIAEELGHGRSSVTSAYVGARKGDSFKN